MMEDLGFEDGDLLEILRFLQTKEPPVVVDRESLGLVSSGYRELQSGSSSSEVGASIGRPRESHRAERREAPRRRGFRRHTGTESQEMPSSQGTGESSVPGCQAVCASSGSEKRSRARPVREGREARSLPAWCVSQSAATPATVAVANVVPLLMPGRLRAVVVERGAPHGFARGAHVDGGSRRSCRSRDGIPRWSRRRR